MKKIMTLIKKYAGEISTIIGSGIFFYNIFNFSKDFDTPSPMKAARPTTLFYYYPTATLLAISLGSMLVVLGIIIIRNRK